MIKLTKNELRNQQTRLSQFVRYLPTLQLKKGLLQFEVAQVQIEREQLLQQQALFDVRLDQIIPLLGEENRVDFTQLVDVLYVKKSYENTAGIEIPSFEKVLFRDHFFSLFDTPAWLDAVQEILQEWVTLRQKFAVIEEKKRVLEKELREVSIRVNLFEKILIPRAQSHIKKIRVFLGDQQLASVAQAKVAKKKIALKRSLA